MAKVFGSSPSLKNFLQSEFPLLQNKRERYQFILSNTLFVIAFYNIYIPFKMDSWEASGIIRDVLSYSGYGLIGGFILFLLQIPLRNLLRIEKFSYLGYFIWFCLELVSVAFAMFLVFGAPEVNQWEEFKISLGYTFSTLVLSYSSCLLMLSLLNLRSKLKQVNSTLIQNQENKKVTFSHENGKAFECHPQCLSVTSSPWNANHRTSRYVD